MNEIVLSYILRKDFSKQQQLLIEFNDLKTREEGYYPIFDGADRPLIKLEEYCGVISNPRALIDSLKDNTSLTGINIALRSNGLLYTPCISLKDENYDFDAIILPIFRKFSKENRLKRRIFNTT